MSRRTQYERAEEYSDVLGRRRRKITIASGSEVHFWDAVKGVESSLTSLGRWMSRANKLANDEFEQEKVDRLVERISEAARAYQHARDQREEWERRRIRIAAMRNDTGRSPEEAALFKARADQEERKLNMEMRRY